MKNVIPSKPLSLLLCLFTAGCVQLQQMTQPPPSPKANWTMTHDFSPDSIPKIAIITEDGAQSGRNQNNPLLTTIEDRFMEAALQKGYRISDRSDVNRVMQEIRFQQSGLTEDDAAHLGKILNVSAVLIVRITGAGVFSQPSFLTINGQQQYNYQAWCNMSARLISVEKAEILGLGSFSSKRITSDRNNLEPALIFTSDVLANGLPSQNSQPAPSTTLQR